VVFVLFETGEIEDLLGGNGVESGRGLYTFGFGPTHKLEKAFVK
jgi:hypothetical protein